MFVQNNNRETIHLVLNGIRINNSNKRTDPKKTIVSSIEKYSTEYSILCRTLNETKQMISLVCVCFRTKTKEKNVMVMTT